MSSSQAWKRVADPAVLMLAVVVLVEITLFAGYHRERWSKSLARRLESGLRTGEALVIRNDGHGYYAWLGSMLVDGDWCFDNEFDQHNPVGDWVPPAEARTGLGRRANPWSVGPACVWAATVVPAHCCFQALQPWGWPWPADGYALPYQLLVGFTTLLVSFAGFGLLYGLCRAYSEPTVAAFAAALITLGTPIVFYSAIEVSMAHGLGTASLAALVWYWQRTYGSERPWRWFCVGLLLGVAALMRWQLVTFAVLPAGEALLQRLGGRSSRRLIGSLVLAGAGTVLALMPQLVAWRFVYGEWFPEPIAIAHNWLHPSWWPVLFAQDRGLFYWTPLGLLMGWSCLRASLRHEPHVQALRLLLVAFVLQVYVLASMWGPGVYLGVAFGMRHLTEALIVTAPGLAMLLERSSQRQRTVLGGLGCGLVLWNLLLMCQYRYGLIPAAGGADLETFLRNIVRLIARKHWLVVGQVLVGPLLLAVIFRRATCSRCLVFSVRRPYNKGISAALPTRIFIDYFPITSANEGIMAKGAGKARKKLPKELAVVRADNCTGCEACIEVCPVDCIYKLPGEDQPSLQSFVDIDLERCIGCSLCERWCPWDAIDMVPTPTIAQHVADKGGPRDYVEKNWERLVSTAQSLAQLAVEQGQKLPA